MGTKQETNPIQVADRLFGTVEFLANNGKSSLNRIASALDLNKSTAHRVLASLQYLGYVRQEDENAGYELTFKVVDVANRFMNKTDILSKVRPYLWRLMEKSGETVHFVRREDADVVYIDKVESNTMNFQMVSKIGNRLPIYRSGVGKAIASTMDDERVREIWNRSTIVEVTPHTITKFEDFVKTLDEIRQKGYALDNEENEIGVRCIAVPLLFHAGSAEYALSISAPVGRMNESRIAELSSVMLHTKQEIEKEFA